MLLTGLARLSGSPVMDLSRDPALAVTPADFWRRYNCSAGQLLHDDLFIPLGSRSRPFFDIFLVFAANGVLHEALSALLTERLLGYQFIFVGVQGAAVLATRSLRPRGFAAVLSWAATLAFNGVTAILFFASVHAGVGWWNSSR